MDITEGIAKGIISASKEESERAFKRDFVYREIGMPRKKTGKKNKVPLYKRPYVMKSYSATDYAHREHVSKANRLSRYSEGNSSYASGNDVYLYCENPERVVLDGIREWARENGIEIEVEVDSE